MKLRLFIRLMVVCSLAVTTAIPVAAQYGRGGDKHYRERYNRAHSYGDVVEIRLSEPGTLEQKMPQDMMNRVRLLRIEGPMDHKDFKFIKKLCDRSRCVDGRDKSVDNYIDLELERARIMSSGNGGLLRSNGERDVLDDALAYSSHLRSIVLPERLKRIGSGALRGCSRLEEVIMPSGVRSFGSSAFSGCSHLNFITLNEGLQSIGSECFNGCSALRDIDVPHTVTEIGNEAFKGSGVQRIGLPYDLLSLGRGAFDDTPLTAIHIPAGTQIESDYLGYMPKLQEITVEDGSRYYTYEDGVLYDNTGSVLLLYPAGRTGDCELPDDVSGIASRAFYGSLVEHIDLPASVTRVDESAFEKCSHLQHISMPGVTLLGKGAFKYCTALESFTTSRDIKVISQEAFEECKSLSSVSLPSGVTAIEARAFKNCPAIESVEFPIGLTEVGKEAFEGNKVLSAIDLPAGLKTIGERAFKNCRTLTRVTLPDACTMVGKEAFRECVALRQIDLNDRLTSLGDNALRETAITMLVLPQSITHVGKKVTEKCKELVRIECHAILPPTLDKESNNKVELYVPASSVNAYRSAKNWKNFKTILPLD